jgi:2-polyprenyl-3-methyl-5-hydroxy-6-metoxy-1,4-benzoquinol methylase
MKDIAIDIKELKMPNTIGNVRLNDNAFKLICDIDLILEMVVCNTLKYNKFTTSEEIFENQETKNIDIYTIESICEALSFNDGVLIKFINGHKVSYKLNSKIYA